MEANRIIDISYASKDEIVRDIDKLLQAQAEISYKAGIREAAWWVKQLTNNPICQYKDNYLCLYKASWQAFLKEKGIEEK